MYDAVFVLVEAFNKLLRKKPDQFRSYTMRNRMGQLLAPAVTNVSANATANNANANRVLDCNTSKGWVNPWEHGDKISRYLRKVLHIHTFEFRCEFSILCTTAHAHSAHILKFSGNNSQIEFVSKHLTRLKSKA